MSESLAEPTNVGPVAIAQLRACDPDREQVGLLLSTAYAEGDSPPPSTMTRGVSIKGPTTTSTPPKLTR